MVIMNLIITIAAICVDLNHCHKDVSKVSKIIKNTLYVSQWSCHHKHNQNMIIS